MENIEYTSDENLRNQLEMENNNRINIIGYVDNISIGIFRQKYRMLKFELCNGTTKMTCILWNELIDQYSHEILVHRIVRIDSGKIKKLGMFRHYRDDYPVEVIVTPDTQLTFYGIHGIHE